jgi:cellulose synthase (UDP-forming)
MALLVLAAVVGLIRLALGRAPLLGTGVNLVWVVYDLVILSVVITAARFRGVEPSTPDGG